MWCGERRVNGCRRVESGSRYTYAVLVDGEVVGYVSAAGDFMMTSMDGLGLPFV